MATNSSENDATTQSEDQALGVGLQSSAEKPNDKQSLSEKINKNSALLYMTMDLAIFFSLWCWTHEIFYSVVGWGVNKKSSIGI